MVQLLTPESALAEIDSWDLVIPRGHRGGSGNEAGATADVHALDESAVVWKAFLEQHGEAALFKGIGPEHITSSAFIFSPDFSQILLTHHRRLHRWVQLGGHVDRDDASLVAAGTREAVEESGLARIDLLGGAPVDFDRHVLHGNFTCHAHWDIGFAFVADPDEGLLVSEESLDVAWWPVDELPNDPDVTLSDGTVQEGQGVCAANFPGRLANVLAHPMIGQ